MCLRTHCFCPAVTKDGGQSCAAARFRALSLVIIWPAVYKQGVPVPSEARQEIKQKAERLTFVSGEMDASAHMAALGERESKPRRR